jgi:hypothetical protein
VYACIIDPKTPQLVRLFQVFVWTSPDNQNKAIACVPCGEHTGETAEAVYRDIAAQHEAAGEVFTRPVILCTEDVGEHAEDVEAYLREHDCR